MCSISHTTNNRWMIFIMMDMKNSLDFFIDDNVFIYAVHIVNRKEPNSLWAIIDENWMEMGEGEDVAEFFGAKKINQNSYRISI